jgi:hypothetical protein
MIFLPAYVGKMRYRKFSIDLGSFCSFIETKMIGKVTKVIGNSIGLSNWWKIKHKYLGKNQTVHRNSFIPMR